MSEERSRRDNVGIGWEVGMKERKELFSPLSLMGYALVTTVRDLKD
jgi:hypothetical protein